MRESYKRNFLWNVIGSVANAALSSMLLVVVTRGLNEQAAGIFSIGFAIATQMWTIGSFELNAFQVTDISGKFLFSHFFSFKIMCCIMMLIASFINVTLEGYVGSKAIIIMLLCIFKMADAFSGVFYGGFQKNGRLDISGFSLTIRIGLSFFVFLVSIVLTKNLNLAIIAMIFVEFIWIISFEMRLMSKTESVVPKFDLHKLWEIFCGCLPLFISSFIIMYVYNLPKYAIDDYCAIEMQAYYNIIFMPASVINLFSIFVLRPMLTSFTLQWKNKNMKKFVRLIFALLIYIGIFTVLAVVVAGICGVQVLGSVYGVNVNAYRKALIVIIVGGGMNAIVNAIANMITVMRKQKLIVYVYGIVALFSTLLTPRLVKGLFLDGAAYAYLLSVGLILIGVTIILVKYLLMEIKRR